MTLGNESMRALSDRLFRVFAILSVLFLMVAGVTATKDRLVFRHGDEQSMILRDERPLAFWSMVAISGVVAVAFGFLAIRRARHLSNDEAA